jgi:septal ring factor EnvC (AmiA/AmiB activator)
MDKIIATLLTSIIWIFSCTSVCAIETISGKRAELQAINGSIQHLQKDLNQNQLRQNDLQQKLKTCEIQIGQISKEISRLNNQLTVQETELQAAKNTEQEIQLQLTNQQAMLAQQIRMIYQLGQAQSFKSIFNSADVNATTRHLVYYRYLNAARTQLLADIKQNLAMLTHNLAIITEQEQNLKIALEKKQQQQTDLLKAQENRQRVIAQLNKKTLTKKQALVTLLTNRQALQTLLTRLENQTVWLDNPSFKTLQGKLSWPINGPVSAAFGSLDSADQHLSGVTIKAPEGTSVRAIYTGKVIFANWLRGFGLVVIINHGGGYISLYARNQTLYAKIGETVTPGDIIASIGNTGGYNKPSLYFEIRRNGIPVDPSKWCSKTPVPV